MDINNYKEVFLIMLTVVKNSEGEVVFQGYGAFTIETIDIEKEFADFDYKKFIEDIRKEQSKIKKTK